MMRHGAGRVELFDQPLEGHLLVAVGIQRLVPHLLEHIAEAVPGVHLHPQHEGVDKESDQIVQGLVQPPGDRGTQHDVTTDADPVQKHSQH